MEQKAFNFREIQAREERLAPGHRMCAGCGGTIAVRNVLKALHPGDKAVIGNATGCLEVSSYMYPYTAYEDSYIHNAFENAGATLSGVETAFHALKKRGKIGSDRNPVNRYVRLIIFRPVIAPNAAEDAISLNLHSVSCTSQAI